MLRSVGGHGHYQPRGIWLLRAEANCKGSSRDDIFPSHVNLVVTPKTEQTQDIARSEYVIVALRLRTFKCASSACPKPSYSIGYNRVLLQGRA